MINIVVTSKPCDGLFYYSYEYKSSLKSLGMPVQVIVITHRKFKEQDYLDSINEKYIHCEDIFFNDFHPEENDTTLIMGRSMMTLGYQDFKEYTESQQETLKKVFSKNLIAVYSENHPTRYHQAVGFFNPAKIIDLCDTDVYPEGPTDLHFEKHINFKIHKDIIDDIKFDHLFLGTNDKYYATVNSIIKDYPDHGIITYDEDYINENNNNVFAPVKNIMGMFKTYVYTKDTFDPAPRIFQECRYFGKEVIYQRDKSIKDGGSVYWDRGLKDPDISNIAIAIKQFAGQDNVPVKKEQV